MLALVLTIAGCAGTERIRWPATMPPSPDRHLLVDVPFFHQEAYQCGPATLAMTMAWSGIHVSPESLASAVFTPSQKGSLQSAMISAVRRYDRIAFLLPGPEALVDEITAGHPVIVLQNLGLSWYPVWHYAVVIGFDAAAGKMILHSGKTAQKMVAVKTFERTWARSDFWGLLVLPPSELPAVAEEMDYLRAVSHLERLSRWETAARGYQTALSRWPDSLPAIVGLGVSLYQDGDLKAAEAVFRGATLKFPDEGILFNNLAQVLIDQGRKTEALDAVNRAVERGGPLKAHFENTLDEIRNQ